MATTAAATLMPAIAPVARPDDGLAPASAGAVGEGVVVGLDSAFPSVDVAFADAMATMFAAAPSTHVHCETEKLPRS